MSTDESTAGAGAPTPRKSAGRTAIAVVAAAALAGTAGFVVANSTGDDAGSTTAGSDTAGSDSAESGGTGSGDTATTVVAADIPGEHRGFDEVHTEEPLATTDWLAERLEEGELHEQGIVLLDVSENLPSSELTPYAEAHIPQAQYVEWSEEFTAPNTREFISAEEFTELAQSLGIGEDSTVVLYGDNNNWFAAYASWVFNLYGVEDVVLLDGGLHKWELYDERELVEEVPSVPAGNFEAKPQNHDLRAFQPEVLEIAEQNTEADGDAVAAVNLVDIRSAEEHDGEVGVDPDIFQGEGAAVWGHIPGSVNVTWTQIVDEETGEFLPAEEIRSIYEEAGVDFDDPIIAYCRIGERASHTWYALSQILGEEVKVYDGSWSEWGNSVGVPVANNSGERAGLWGQSGD
ncbi:sulfurtransferase [Nesterenkonia sandarakina]|uniref:Sulfurtransferase n=1 Tax=Nesterenkonia sandarakina TaxID=272918 RepID=A0A2T0YHL6_9MICC|nr:sulfurtransferase [Nesterenkonia sandarakina]PRZ14574.1 thiosulfate/3-mercaptopyruvate sulfurtransferase [Nesterenkonia sandarakina]